MDTWLRVARAATLTGLLAWGAAGAQEASPAVDPAWTWIAIPDGPVPFQGMPDQDTAGQGSTMMYGPGLVGFFAAIATHAAIQAGIDSHKKTQAQLLADRVLEPFKDVLASLTMAGLQRDALAGSSAAASGHVRLDGDAPPSDWQVVAAPQFSMSPDAAALVLDEAVAVRAPGGAKPTFEQVVRVVSPPVTGDAVAYWQADGGRALKTTAALLLSQAVDLARGLALHPFDEKAAPFRSVHYALGRAARSERAQVLSESCSSFVLRTLRGNWMSVPHRPDAALPAGCPAIAPAGGDAPVMPSASASPPTPASAPEPAPETATKS